MLLAAHSIGVGAGPVTSFSRGAVNVVLRLPDRWVAELILCLGCLDATRFPPLRVAVLRPALSVNGVYARSHPHLAVAKLCEPVEPRTADYTPTEAPMLRKNTTIELMRSPTNTPALTGLGTMKTRTKMMNNSQDNQLGMHREWPSHVAKSSPARQL
jgi:hypothetical protein